MYTANEKLSSANITDIMQTAYIDYSMSVIISRALPDARDGLKPVQRRILFSMDEMGIRPDKGHVKCARVVGQVMGVLHPHGDVAIYDALEICLWAALGICCALIPIVAIDVPLSDDFDLSSVTNDEMNLRMHANWGKIFVYEATRVYVIASVACV